MSHKQRFAARKDGNQDEIISKLLEIPGVTVELGHDDILVGWRGRTYWYELKLSKNSKLKDSQKRILKNYSGHYKVVWSLDMILKDMGIIL